MDDQVEVVRKSIVRICFKWPNPAKTTETLTAVLCGVIVSIKDDGSCLVLADPSLFRKGDRPFVVNLPIPGGGGVGTMLCQWFHLPRFWVGLVLQLRGNDYVQPVKFETEGVRTGDRVWVFVFPNRDFFTPAAYNPGYVRDGDDWAAFEFEAAFNSYGYLGAPIFNDVGHLVGISYEDGDARSVSFLKDVVFSGAEIRRHNCGVLYLAKILKFK